MSDPIDPGGAPIAPADGPILFAYDGSDLARLAIAEAGRLLRAERDAVVVCVWQPFDVGFTPADGSRFDAENPAAVRAAAQSTAAAGAAHAEAAGFHARGVAVEAAPIWQGIAQVAEEHDTSAIVLGSHGRTRLAGVLVGSVAASVATHCRRTVLISYRDA